MVGTRWLIGGCIFALTLACSSAEDADDVRRGTYWYEDPPSTDEMAEKDSKDGQPQYTMPEVPPIEELMTWHPRDISALFTAVHEYHVMAPTLETGAAVQVIKAVMNRKSRAAAAVEQLAILANPGISGVAENAVIPTARSVQRKEKDAAIDSRLLSERNKYAYIILTQEGCGACQLQRNIMANYQDLFGWEIKEVDIIKNPQASARFGVRVTPTTLLVSRDTGDWQTIAIGAESLPALKFNSFQAIRLIEGEIAPSQWLTAPNQANSLYDPGTR